MIKSLSIIYPVFNEEDRLSDCFNDIKKFEKITKIKKIEYIFVDDGSIDESKSKIQKYIKNKKNYYLISLGKNFGKGKALKKGVQKAKFDWMLTIDTDVSVKLSQIENWIKKKYIKNHEIYFGSRNLKKSKVNYLILRKIAGLVFILICRVLFKISILDTQCGFKLYKKNVGKKIFSKLKENGFTHDIEIVLQAKKFDYKIMELPLTWVHKKNSKINLIRDSLSMLFALLKIRKKLIY